MVGTLLRRLRHVVRQRQLDADVRAEIEFHRDLKQRDLERLGMSSSEAAVVARRAMGNITLAREDARAVWVARWLDTALRNIRHGCRICWNSPTFALTSILTLGLCIGANAAIYTLVDWILIRPLPFPEPDRLAWVETRAEQNGRSVNMQRQTGGAFLALAEEAKAIAVGAIGGTLTVNLVDGDQATAVDQQRMSASLVDVLGVSPFLGRAFTQDEDRLGGPAAVMLSYDTWTRTFGGNTNVIGHRVMLRGEPYTIVGVMPQHFRTNAPADIWTPLRVSITGEGAGSNYSVVARLRTGIGWPAANGEVETVGHDFFARVSPAPGVTRRFVLAPIQRAMTRDLRQPLFLLWGAVAIVLLIGCVNLAGLQLARAVRRTPEIATRMAVGGGRVAIIWQLLAESVVLAAAGGLVGAGIGALIVRLFGYEVARLLPETVRLDGRVYAFTAGVSLLTTFVFGLIPALKASRVDVRSMIVHGTAVHGGSHWTRRLIVVSEIAMTVVLLVGAGLFVRTFEHFEGLQPGFDGRGIVAASLSLQDVRYETSAAVNRLFDHTLTRIRQLPGVESAAVGLTMPYERALNNPWRRSVDPAVQPDVINMTYVTPQYFQTLRIPIVRGRGFTESDAANAPPVAVVNQAFVRRYDFGDEILGYQLDPREPLAVIGVVGDVPQTNGGLFGFEPIDTIPCWYIPAAQANDALIKTVHNWLSPSWVVRTSRPTSGIASEMQRALKEVDPLLPFNRFRTVDDLRGEALLLQRTAAVLFSALAGLAVLLSSIGLYGLVATSIEDRERELGLRIALGSKPRQTFWTAGWPGVAMSVVGISAGLLLARTGAVLLRSLVWGVQTTDPLTFVGAAVVVAVVAVLAVVIPTLRIFRLNPIEALRSS